MQRRALLAGAAALSVSSLSGCLDILGSGGDDPDFESVTRWSVPVPDGTPLTDSYEIDQRSPAEMSELYETSSLETPESWREPVDYGWGPIDLGSLERRIEIRSPDTETPEIVAVSLGSFDTDAVRDHLENEFGAETIDYEGFDCYEFERGTDPGAAIAVDDGVVIDADPFSMATASVEDLQHVIDTRQGRTERFVERDETLDMLAERTELTISSSVTRYDPDRSGNPIDGVDSVEARAWQATVDGDTVRVRDSYAFPDEQTAADVDDEHFLEQATQHVDPIERSTTVDGRVRSANFEITAAAFLE